MRIRLIPKKTSSMLFLYWIVLLAWQNLRGASGNRSGGDIVIKTGLLILLILHYYSNYRFISRKVFFVTVVLVICTFIPVINVPNITNFLYYFFPILFFSLTYGYGYNAEINKEELLRFSYFIIIAVAYMVVYALIFCTNQFTTAFSLTSAYGNELRSFLFSNCEYGLYLAFGIMCSILCLEMDTKIGRVKRIVLVFTIFVFLVNLILTFSRTSILSFVAMITVYLFFYSKSKVRYVILLALTVFVIAYFASDTLENFIVQIVFKNNYNSGRSDLVNYGMALYNEGNYIQKFLGQTYSLVRDIIEVDNEVTSVHNAYVQMLITNGWKGCLFLTGVIVNAIIDIHRTSRCHPEYKSLLRLFYGFIIVALIFMLTTTATLFYSTIDSFFLTIMTMVIPKYIRNAINNGNFVKKEG